MAEGRARIREMRVDKEIQLIRQAELPCEVTVDEEVVALRIQTGGGPVVAEITFPGAYPFVAPEVGLVEGQEAVQGGLGEDSLVGLPSLQVWTPSTQIVGLVQEIVDVVTKAARETEAHGSATSQGGIASRRVSPLRDGEHAAAPDAHRTQVTEPYYRPGQGVAYGELERRMTFWPTRRLFGGTDRDELRYLGLSAESLAEVKPHPRKLNHVIVQYQRPLRTLRKALLRGKGSQVELHFARVEVVLGDAPPGERGGEGAATRVVLSAESVTYGTPEARALAGQIVERMRRLGVVPPGARGGGRGGGGAAAVQPSGEALARQRERAMAEMGRLQGMLQRAPTSVLEVQRVSETYMRAAEAAAALDLGGEEGHEGVMRALHAYLARDDVAAVLDGERDGGGAGCGDAEAPSAAAERKGVETGAGQEAQAAPKAPAESRAGEGAGAAAASE